jgi:hypothetical protein
MGRKKGTLDCQPRQSRKPKSLAAKATTAVAYAMRKKTERQGRLNSARGVTERQQQSFLASFAAPIRTPALIHVPTIPASIISRGETSSADNASNDDAESTCSSDSHDSSDLSNHDSTDNATDSSDEDYYPTDDVDDDSKLDEKAYSPRFCPQMEQALETLLNHNDKNNKRRIHSVLKKNHWLYTPRTEWIVGELKFKVRCCAPHLQFDGVRYTCIACRSSDCKLKGWSHHPKARLVMDFDSPYLLASYTYKCLTCSKTSMCSDPRSLAFLGYDRAQTYDFYLTHRFVLYIIYSLLILSHFYFGHLFCPTYFCNVPPHADQPEMVHH